MAAVEAMTISMGGRIIPYPPGTPRRSGSRIFLMLARWGVTLDLAWPGTDITRMAGAQIQGLATPVTTGPKIRGWSAQTGPCCRPLTETVPWIRVPITRGWIPSAAACMTARSIFTRSPPRALWRAFLLWWGPPRFSKSNWRTYTPWRTGRGRGRGDCLFVQ